MHVAHGADNGFYPQPGHVGDLLAGKFEAVAFGADILLVFLEITQEGGDAALRVVGCQFLQYEEFETETLRKQFGKGKMYFGVFFDQLQEGYFVQADDHRIFIGNGRGGIGFIIEEGQLAEAFARFDDGLDEVVAGRSLDGHAGGLFQTREKALL